MYDRDLVIEILEQILTASKRIERRFVGISDRSSGDSIHIIDNRSLILIYFEHGKNSTSSSPRLSTSHHTAWQPSSADIFLR